MKVCVLGSTGFIGAAVYEALKAKDIEVKALATASAKTRFPLTALDESARWIGPHIRNAAVVFLCSGRTGGVGRMASDPLSFIYPNVRIHMNVFQQCIDEGVRRVVCIQSTTGYRDSPLPMTEDDYLGGALHPAYEIPGNAHRFIYRLAQMHKDKLDVVFFRPSNVYGPRNDFDAKNAHVIEATVRKVVERQDPFVIWGDGSEVRDAVYIDDLAEAMALGIDCEPGAYNIASGDEMSVREIVSELMTAADFWPKIEYDATKPTAIAARRLNISKARVALGWEPRVTMREGLRRTLSWYEQQVSLSR